MHFSWTTLGYHHEKWSITLFVMLTTTDGGAAMAGSGGGAEYSCQAQIYHFPRPWLQAFPRNLHPKTLKALFGGEYWCLAPIFSAHEGGFPVDLQAAELYDCSWCIYNRIKKKKQSSWQNNLEMTRIPGRSKRRRLSYLQ